MLPEAITREGEDLMQADRRLFSPVALGAIKLKHRVVMAPLTRLRSDVPGDAPNDLMLEYYTQRASEGGLIITEATAISVTGRGYFGAPGIYSDQQVAGWRRITDAVHAKGGKIVLQLWHVGRTSHIDMTDGAIPIGPSEDAPYEGKAFTKNGWVPVTPNRSLQVEEIPALLADYRQAARRAKEAGFDGVELHAGNGYLLDQFLQNGSNRRKDEYGGSPENRSRLLFQVVEELLAVWSSDRIGVRLSPSTKFNGMSDNDPSLIFGYVAKTINRYSIAYLHIIEPRVSGNTEVEDGLPPVAAGELRKLFHGSILAAGGFDGKGAEAILETGDADLVVFGRFFIANPDLPKRLQSGWTLNPYDRTTFYGGDARGYIDYPFYDEVTA
jgi:N-ethylmaleimide reductase